MYSWGRQAGPGDVLVTTFSVSPVIKFLSGLIAHISRKNTRGHSAVVYYSREVINLDVAGRTRERGVTHYTGNNDSRDKTTKRVGTNFTMY